MEPFACFFEMINAVDKIYELANVSNNSLVVNDYNLTDCGSDNELANALLQYRQDSQEREDIENGANEEDRELWSVVNKVDCKLDLIEGNANKERPACQNQEDQNGFIEMFY